MRFAILGPLAVELDGRAPDLGTPKQRALLVRLLLDAPRPVSVDRIVEDLWSGTPPGHATASLQAYVSNLRRVLEPGRPPRTPATVLVTRPPGYLLRLPDADSLDSSRFRRLAERAGTAHVRGDHAAAHALAVDALALWRGPALLDVRDQPFAAATVTELEELREAVRETRLASALELGRAPEVAAEVEALVAADPLRERLWELLALALYRAGRPAAALARLRRVRKHLDDELGLHPGPRLQQLERAILHHDHAVLNPAPAPRAADPAPAGLPSAAPGGNTTPAEPGPGLDEAGRPPLVGRDALLDRLTARLRSAAVSGPRWLLVTGEAGIGKTRLAEAVRQNAREAGWGVVVARCHDDPDTPPFWIWSQVLRELVPDAPGPAVDPLPALAAVARAESGGDTARFALYEGVRRAVENAARARPVLVVIDDLQWADGDSLRALRFLAVQLSAAPVVVLATVREGEVDDLVADVLATVERGAGAERIVLPPIDAPAVRAIAEALAGGPVADTVVAGLHARSGGNPLFATELARLTAAAAGGSVVPRGVREVVGRRLARLPEDVQGALAVAAVAGEEVDLAVLAAAEGTDVAGMLERLDPALATGVLVEDDAALRVRFSHALVRESLLAGLGAVQRRRVHARIADALRRSRPGAVSPEIAHHLAAAGVLGDLAAARRAASDVAAQAVERLAFDEAARWYGRAVELLDQHDAAHGPDLRARYDLLLARGDALYRSGQVRRAREALVGAVEAAMELDDLDAVAGAAAALAATGGVWTWVDIGDTPPGVLGVLGSVLDRLGPAPTAARARLLSTMATGLYYGDDPERMDAVSGEAVAIARTVDDPGLLADVLLDRAFLLRPAVAAQEIIALADEALSLPGLTGLQRVVGHGRRLYGLLHTGDLPAAVQAHRCAADLARTFHLLVPQMQLTHFPAGLAVAQGRFADAQRLLAEARAREDSVDLPRPTTGVIGLEAILLRLQGRLHERKVDLREFAAAAPMRSFQQLYALALLAADDRAGAHRVWLASRDLPGVPWLELVQDALEVEVRDALLPPGAAAVLPSPDDTALLRVLAARQDGIAAGGIAYPWLPMTLALGAHEHRLGLLDNAEKHLRRAAAQCEEWGAVTWTTLARWRLAAVLAERGDAAEAARVAATARSTAEQIGLVLPAVPGAPIAASTEHRSR